MCERNRIDNTIMRADDVNRVGDVAIHAVVVGRIDVVVIPICPNNIIHIAESVVCFVNMSAACFLVSMYSGM